MTARTDDFQFRARIERLESLLKRAFAAAAAGGLTSFAGPIVANQAAATALPLVTYTTARQVYTLAQEAIWQYVPGVAGAVGVPPLAANEVITAAGGVLARTNYSSPKWRTGVNDIFIDPANGAADDENSGLTALAPLATGQELFRRWGWGTPVVVGPNLATSVTGWLNVNIVSSILTPDRLDVNVIVMSDSNGIRFVGGTPTTIRTSTLTGASTPMDANAAAGGTRLRLVDAAVVSWAADIDAANRRGRITTGAQAGATFMPQTNVGVGGAVDCSAAQTVNELAFSQSPTTVTPANGSTYVIESLVSCNFGMCIVGQTQNPAFGGFNSFTNFVNLNFPAIGTNGISWSPAALVALGNFSAPFFNFYQCTFDRNLDLTACGGAQLIACYFTAGLFNFSPGGQATVNGGGMHSITGSQANFLWGSTSNISTVDFNFVADRSLVFFVGMTNGKLFASWNASAVAGLNTAGHGVVVGINGFSGQSGNVRFSSQVWGAGNGGAGILIGSGCRGVGGAKNITGVQGDIKLAQALAAWWFAASIYNPIGAGLALSWANIAAAQPGGFGGSAHEPHQDAHWVLPETTA